MNKSFLTVTALLLAGSLCASADWKESTKMQSTDKVKYTYTEGATTNFFGTDTSFTGISSSGSANEVHHRISGLKVDFTQNARYHITFEVIHAGYDAGVNDYPSSALLYFVNDNNDVSLLFGNGSDTAARIGCILNRDVTTNDRKESLVGNSSDTHYWSTSGVAYGNGRFQYDIIFETFSDQSINDKIYFGVKNETTGVSTYYTAGLLDSSHLQCGGHAEQVFDDIGFHIVGNAGGGINHTGGQPGVTVVGNSSYQPQSKMTVYTRTVEVVPEPSAFGLLAGLGAIALAVSRRRRSR